ncbi:TPA: hypothetical protein ACH3X3_000265 [Trebouxia sp. C0006]
MRVLGQVCKIIHLRTALGKQSSHTVAPANSFLCASLFSSISRHRVPSTMVEGLSDNCWNQGDQSTEHAALSRDLETDVCIVGAGIAGLTTAYRLAVAGKKVVILEGRVRGAGQSGKDTGELLAWNNHQLSTLKKSYGQKVASQVVQSHLDAIEVVHTLVKQEMIPCQYTPAQGYIQASERTLTAEAKAFAGSGAEAKQVNLGGGSEVGGFQQCLEFSGSAVLNPVQYLNGLAEAFVAKGGQIYEQTRVQKPDTNHVTTMAGNKVTARDGVVLATGCPITKNLLDSAFTAMAVHGKQFPRRRYAVALEIAKGSVKNAVYADTEDPHHSVRVVEGASGGGGDLLVVAGEEHDQGISPESYTDVYNKLESWAKQRWTSAQKRTHQWSWTIFETQEMLGLYGKSPTSMGNYYIATGDCGHILTGGTLAGMIISDAILGKKNVYAELYSPSRHLTWVPPLLPPLSFTYIKNTVTSIVSMVAPQLHNVDIEDMAPNSGATVQKGLRKVAVYKDEEGKKHAFSALCPHLGCLLQWNPQEKEWNCPCHGSCFSKTGTNLMGPSTLDMTPLKHLSD